MIIRKVVSISFFACLSLISLSYGELTADFKTATNKAIDSLRKSDCQIGFTFKGADVVDTGFSISARLIKHHFGFGAAICWDSGFAKLGIDKYGKVVKDYFEWATPENEMKWYYNDTTGNQPCVPADYRDADSLVDWCLANGIHIRGHNLFWNERVEFQGYCARPYGPYDSEDSARTIKTLLPEEQESFIGEMQTRMGEMVTRYKDKVSHWDAVNEVVHFTTDNDGKREVKVPGLLATWTGKTGNSGAEVFNWVLDTARSIDPTVKLCVNEYNVIEKAHDEDAYIKMINDINKGAKGGKINIVGFEGHFGDMISRGANGSYAGYESLINKIGQGINIAQDTSMKFWFTEIDWNNKTSGNPADNMEELMRFAYSRKDFGGMLLWIWWQGRLWRDDLSSFLVDKDLNPTATGKRWKSLKDTLWTTNTTVKATSDGKCAFKGFQGTYVVTTKKGSCTQIDTIDVLPGSSNKHTITLGDNFASSGPVVGVHYHYSANKNNTVIDVNGKQVALQHVNNTQLYLSVYSLSGKRVAHVPIGNSERSIQKISTPAGCHIYRLEDGNNVIISDLSVQIGR
jgi:endo-1,4-beta-xylanase